MGKALLFIGCLAALSVSAESDTPANETVLWPSDATELRAQPDSTLAMLPDGTAEVRTGVEYAYPGVRMDILAGECDLSPYGRVTISVSNTTDRVEMVQLSVKGETVQGQTPGGRIRVGPLQSAELHVNLLNVPWALDAPLDLVGMRGFPKAPGQGSTFDLRRVRSFHIFLRQDHEPGGFVVRRVSASGLGVEQKILPAATFLPFVDRYGQFSHDDWPGKVHEDADLAAARDAEAAWLKENAAGPIPDADQYGGWTAGPQLEATGFFRTEKVDGKWWLVDPEGRLYWSFGPVRVTPSSGMTPMNGDPCKPQRGNALPLPDRDCLFAELPPPPDAASATTFSQFWTTHDDLLLPFYRARGQTRVFDFSSANLYRKYGADYRRIFADLAHRRLRSWGANTIANSSDLDICLMDRTPYTDRYEIHSRPIAGHKGGWWDFCDPFDPSFRAEARQKTVEYRRQFEDPWCFGFFVDNEHHWGQADTLALSTLKSPADQPCKRVFRDRLKAKYGEIAKLNTKWRTSYADWDKFLTVTKTPDPRAAKEDLEAFTVSIAEEYYRIIREELKRAAPGKLYLGCRWAGGAPLFTVKAAAKYCDVLSYNIYRRHLREFKLPDGIDKPILVGEFHFGALDRGPFCPGLILLENQEERGKVYVDYVRSALEHPQFVGVHWHQFSDQATSGRFDGENMQVGWTDVCDTPYWETIHALREIGYDLYPIRAGGK
jgi:hypothetical protein